MNILVDKRALPFPEPGLLQLAMRRPSYDQTALSPTEKAVAAVWARHLANVFSARTIAPNDNFFDLGGHSLVAQYVLFDLRKEFSGTNITLGALFQNPTLRGFATELDRLQDPIGLQMNNQEMDGILQQKKYYSTDRETLTKELPIRFEPVAASGKKNVFLTGATGFLGAHIVDELVHSQQFGTIFVHVRAESAAAGLRRVQNTCTAYGLHKIDDHVKCIPGDLARPILGVSEKDWETLSKEVDVIM